MFLLTNPDASAPRKVILTGVSDDGTEVSDTFGRIEAGTWTITETDWSWTYTPDSASKSVAVNDSDVTVEFANTKRTVIPANDEAIQSNVFTL